MRLGIENVFLSELPTFSFLVLGIISQLYLSKILSVPRVATRTALVCQVLVHIANMQPFKWWFAGLASAADGVVMLWWWSVIPAALMLWMQRRFFDSPFDPRRRALLRTSVSALAAAPAVALGFGIITRKELTVREVAMKFANLPQDLRGLRLVQLSDIHMSPFYAAVDLARAVDAANGLRADVMLVTGDLITDGWDPLDRCLQELTRLRAAHGIWGCMGNHEQRAKVQGYTAKKGRELGIRFLRQEGEMLRFGDAKLNLVGVDHQKRNLPYLQHTAGLVVPHEFNVLLSHNPDVFPVAEKQGFQLTISGHTHGGQINLGLLGNNYNVVDLITPFTKGAYHINQSSLYVNSGLGTIGVPVRLGSPSEVTLITLCDS